MRQKGSLQFLLLGKVIEFLTEIEVNHPGADISHRKIGLLCCDGSISPKHSSQQDDCHGHNSHDAFQIQALGNWNRIYLGGASHLLHAPMCAARSILFDSRITRRLSITELAPASPF